MIKIHDSESSIEIDDNVNQLNNKSGENILSLKQQLANVKPHQWNNIAYPLVDCIKLILKDLKAKDLVFEAHKQEYEKFVAKTEFQQIRLDNEVDKRDEQYDSKLARIEKNITTIYNTQRKQLETEIVEIK